MNPHHKIRKKKLIVEISGTPKSGKDSLILRLNKYAKLHGLNVSVIKGGATDSSIDKSHELELLNWTITHLMAEFLENTLVAPSERKLLVCNRGVFDRIAWIECFKRKKLITLEQAEVWLNLLLSEQFQLQNTYISLLITPSEVAISRDDRIKDGLSQQRIMNESFLAELNSAYDYAWEKYKSYFKNAIVLDERKGVISLDDKWERIKLLVDNQIDTAQQGVIEDQ